MFVNMYVGMLICLYNCINQDLGYDESLSGQPGACLMKKIFFYIHAFTKLQKILHFEIQNDFQNIFHSYDILYNL